MALALDEDALKLELCFDLDAVGIMHQKSQQSEFLLNHIFAAMGESIEIVAQGNFDFTLFSLQGKPIASGSGIPGKNQMQWTAAAGWYLLQLHSNNQTKTFRICLL